MSILEKVLARTETPQEYDNVLKYVSASRPDLHTAKFRFLFLKRFGKLPTGRETAQLPNDHCLVRRVPRPRREGETEFELRSFGPCDEYPTDGRAWEGFGDVRVLVSRKVRV